MTFNAVMDQIETLWEALTPAGTANPGYRRARTKTELEGSGAHRAFYFGAPSGDIPLDEGHYLINYDGEFDAVLILSALGHDLLTLSTAVENEAHALISAVITNGSWPANTIHVIPQGFKTAELPGEQIEVTIPFKVLVARATS